MPDRIERRVQFNARVEQYLRRYGDNPNTYSVQWHYFIVLDWLRAVKGSITGNLPQMADLTPKKIGSFALYLRDKVVGEEGVY